MTQDTNTAIGAANDSLLLCASDLQHSAIYDNHVEMQACIRAVANRIAALASAAAPAEPAEAEMVCAEAYQVVGLLLIDLGIFDTKPAMKILDNLSQAKLAHKDVLPWSATPPPQPDTAYAALPRRPGYSHESGRDTVYGFTSDQMLAFADATHALRAACAPADSLEITLPNNSGSTQCIVRWQVETPKGWAGAWNREALEYLIGRTPADSGAAPAGEVVAGIEAAAKLLERKADDFARENGSDDLCSLSFGRGAHADAKLEYHSTLLELAEEIRSLAPPPPAQAADSVLEDAARYRWLAAHCRSTSEHWGGRWSIVVDGPAPELENGEYLIDEAIDAAMAAARKQGENHDNT